MAFDTLVVDKFKGLNLAIPEQNLGLEWASTVTNVDFPQAGGIRGRGGFPNFSTTNQAAGINYLMWRSVTNQFLAVGPGEINAYSTAGVKNVPAGAPTWAATAVTPPAAIGTGATNAFVYVASVNAGAAVQLKRYADSNTVGDSPVVTKPQFVAVYPGQSRLVYAGFFAAGDTPSGANGDRDTVFFSDPGTPETVTATNFVRLDPGDDERFSAVVGWQNQLFVFKNSKMYVFYGVATDDDGLPIFDYRGITLPDPIPVTAAPWNWIPAAAGPDGVYFVGTRGLWRTTGSVPVRVQTPVDPIFANSPLVDFRYTAATQGEVSLGWAGDRMYMRYVSGIGQDLVLMWNQARNAWSVWVWANNGAFTSTPLINRNGTFVAYKIGGGAVGNIGKYSQNNATDGVGTLYTWNYQSGFSDLGSQGEKRMRFVDVYGQNSIMVQLFAKGRRGATPSLGSAQQTKTLGPSTSDTERARYNLALKGRTFGFELDNFGSASSAGAVEKIELRFSQGTNT